MAKFRKKPVEIEAVRVSDILAGSPGLPQWALDALRGDFEDNSRFLVACTEVVRVFTLEGVMVGEMDDWIIRGVQGELYPCKPAIFEQTYEAV